MHQLILAARPLPAEFVAFLDEEIEKEIVVGQAPHVIYNPQTAFDSETGVMPFETFDMVAFGIYVSNRIFGFDWTGHTFDAHAPLPDALRECIIDYLSPDIAEESVDELHLTFDGLTVSGLSNAHLMWMDLSHHAGGTMEIQDDYFQAWSDYCQLAFERMMTLRLTFLSVVVVDEDDGEHTTHIGCPYADLLDHTEARGYTVVHPEFPPHELACEATVRYVQPIRGGGFTCMS